MKFASMVTVTAMGPCPPIEKGKGRVVTMTVTHENSHVFELELSGFDAQGRALTETLCPTDVHKLYSVERGWVMTKNLRVGEVLRTQTGAATITSIKRKAGDHRVYNFEVEATHAYYVGHTRTLSHNVDCPVTKSDIAGYLPDKSQQAPIYRTGSQTDNALTDPTGVSFRNSVSSSADPRVTNQQVFRPGDKIYAVDPQKLPPGSVMFDDVPSGHVSVKASPDQIRAAIIPQRPDNPLSGFGLKCAQDGTSYKLPK